jgi:hypothetical protein
MRHALRLAHAASSLLLRARPLRHRLSRPTVAHRLKSALAVVFTVLVATGLAAAPAQAQSERTLSRTFDDFAADGSITVETHAGAVRVTAWDRNAVQVDVRLEGSEQQVTNTDVRFNASGSTLTVESDFDALESEGLFSFFGGGDPDRPDTFYTLRVPRTARLSIDVFSATVETEGLRADLEIDAFSSTMRVRGHEGEVRADSFSGDLVVEDLTGNVVFDTFSGEGEIRFAQITGDCQMDSFSGDVTMYLPRDASFDVDLEGFSGDLQSEFETTNLRQDDDGTRGTVGGGGPRIRFDTFSGDLRLRAL